MDWTRAIIFAGLLGCGPSVGERGSGDSASGTGSSSDASTTGVEQGSSSSGRGTTTETGGSSTGSSSSTTEVCEGICFVDFPCNGSEDTCLDDQTIQLFETISCSEAIEDGIILDCDPDCCEGSSCAPSMTVGCEPETSCVETIDGPACTPNAQVCNLTDRPCGPMQLCEFGPQMCEGTDQLGICVDVGDPCPEPKDAAPQCGCDGVTYASACERRNAGAVLDHPGECF